MLSTKILSAMAANAPAAESDPYFSNVSLLLHGDGTNGTQNNTFLDSSSNNFAVTRYGNATQGTFSPFSNSNELPSNINGGGYFDGVGGYLSVPYSTDFHFQLYSNYTFEVFVYIKSLSTNQPIFSSTDVGASAANDYEAYINTSGFVVFRYWKGNTVLITTTTSISANSWVHLAFVYSGGILTIYINGVPSASSAISGTITRSTVPFSVGGARNGSAGYVFFNGYLSNVRVVKGTALYTSSFTPPTTPLTAVTNTSLLLNFTNAGIYDSAGQCVLETVGNAQVSTAQKKYGTGAMYFDDSSYLNAPSHPAVVFGISDFTVEGWMFPTNNKSIVLFSSMNFGTSSSTGFAISTDNVRGIFVYSNRAYIASGSTFPANNTWTHVAVTRRSGIVYVWINGSLSKSASFTNNLTATSFQVGYWFDFYRMKGYIDDFRITNGVARYTANFTPPTRAFLDK